MSAERNLFLIWLTFTGYQELLRSHAQMLFILRVPIQRLAPSMTRPMNAGPSEDAKAGFNLCFLPKRDSLISQRPNLMVRLCNPRQLGKSNISQFMAGTLLLNCWQSANPTGKLARVPGYLYMSLQYELWHFAETHNRWLANCNNGKYIYMTYFLFI